MISVLEATKIVLQHSKPLEVEAVNLASANGRLLCENLIADRDFPPFTRVSMDGIAIDYQSFAQGQRVFKTEGLQAAGMPQMTLLDPQKCIEVMTGAVLPNKTDTVIRYEDISLKGSFAQIMVEQIQQGQNAHLQASDREQGATIIKANRLLSAAEIGVAATIGKTQLKVAKRPRIVLISTGDELVEVSQQPLPHQIRKSNIHTISATLEEWGLETDKKHLNDEKNAIHQSLKRCLEQYEVIILSGGVSKGKLDFIPEVLEELGVEKLFHKVMQRPGKPFWFGKSLSNVLIFAFPGNPVSSFVCTHRYFYPWWRASLGLMPPSKFAILNRDFRFNPDLTYFLQVKIKYASNGSILATPMEGKGSGDLANLVEADGFLELPQGKKEFKKGETYPLILYR